MKELKNMKGITLVSLVITIIVLIILAAVSINMTIGTDGIITKAKNAKENMELAAREEQERLNELSGYLSGETQNGGLAYDKIAQLKEQYDNLNTEYIDFKTQIAQAITNKGVATSSTDTVETMVSNIEQITGTSSSNIKLDALIPYMTSNTEPSGTVSASSVDVGVTTYYPYRPLLKSPSDWIPATTTGNWWMYEWEEGTEVEINMIYIVFHAGSCVGDVQYWNGTDWVTIKSIDTSVDTRFIYVPVEETVRTTKIRLANIVGQPYFRKFQCFGSVVE